MKPNRGGIILAFGILSLVVCPFFGLAAWIMADRDLEDMDHGRMDTSGRDLTKAGRICGIVGTVLLGVQVLIVVAAVVGMIVFRA